MNLGVQTIYWLYLGNEYTRQFVFQIVLYNGKDPTIISQCSTQIRIPLICTLRFIYMNLYQKDLILIN